MRIFKNEHGYTLLITVTIIILFMILGMSLFTLTTNGIKNNGNRENYVQATSLAEKGIDYINTQINKELMDSIGTGIPRNTFIDNLNNILNSYSCKKDSDSVKDPSKIYGISKVGNTGSYNVCIDQIDDALNEDGTVNQLSKLVKIRSVGKANSKEKILNNYFIIGSDSIPEALKYAVGAFIDQNNEQSKQTDGNLFLLGGSDITGDLKVEGNLISSNTGYIYNSGNNTISDKYISSLPASKKLNTLRNSRITVGKNLYSLDSSKLRNNANYLNITAERTFSNSDLYKLKNNIDDLFITGYSPSLIKGYTSSTSLINVENEISNDKLTKNINQYTSININNYSVNDQKYSNSSIKYIYKNYQTKISLTLNGTNYYKNLYTYSDLTLSSSDLNTESSFIDGDLNIKGTSTIAGVYYITGSVNIEDATLTSNAIFYVKGNVKVSGSALKGLKLQNNKTGSLIIFANNSINFTNISTDNSNPSEIYGFFYSNNNLHIGGVQSNIKITGGVSAKNIDLNAIRGTKSKPSNNVTTSSRLQIIYNQDIIDTYSNLKQKEPYVFNINPVYETKRE